MIDPTGRENWELPAGCHWLSRTCLLTNREQILLPDLECGDHKVEQKHRASERVAAPKHPTKKVKDLSSMSIDELWALHQEVAATLVAKITAEKEVIEDRLRLLTQVRSDPNGDDPAG